MRYDDSQLEYVYDQLDEIGFDVESCTVTVTSKNAGRIVDVVIEIPTEQYAESADFLDGYLSELSSDFSYTFPDVQARYSVRCFGESSTQEEDTRDPLSDGLVELEYFSEDEFDEDDAIAQYRDEGLTIDDGAELDMSAHPFASMSSEEDEDDW